jgi:acetate---CoA ligase (ADP-forming)
MTSAHTPHALACLLHPASVAIIGASDETTRIGGRPIAYMRSQGFGGQIWPVNPKRSTIQGLPAFESIQSLPGTPEVAIVAVAAASVASVIGDLAAAGTKACIVFTAGFAEVGEAGAELQQNMLAARGASGLRILGPNTLGVINARSGFFGSFISSVELGMPRAGRIAIISQSGAYGGHLLCAATAAGMGISACAMTGNESDISLGEVVHMMVDDDDTDVIALYSEGIREGTGLLRALAAAQAKRKPVVMMKVGRSAVGSQAAQSHTASIAGNDRVIDAVLREFGVVRATTTEQMLDIARLATRKIFPTSNALGVVTVSGGAGVIISDAASDAGLTLPPMPADAQARLKQLVPFSSARNPVDMTAQFQNDMSLIATFTEALVKEGGYPSVLAFFTYTGGAPSVAPHLRAQLKSVRDRYPDRLYALCVQASKEQIRGYEEDGFCVFEDPSRAVNAIAAMGRFSFEQSHQQAPPMCPTLHWPQGALNERESKAVLTQAGIASAPEALCSTQEQALAAARSFGWPVVLKIVSPDITHKSDMGGVLLGIANAEQLEEGFTHLLQNAASKAPRARIDGILVAKQLQGGVECIMGITQDPVFGPVAVFGLGGIFVEILQDIVLHRCPFGIDVATRMIHSIQGLPLLQGARGTAPADIPALAAMLSALSAFAVQAGPTLQSVDLNPVLAMPLGQGAFALDAVVVRGEHHG